MYCLVIMVCVMWFWNKGINTIGCNIWIGPRGLKVNKMVTHEQTIQEMIDEEIAERELEDYLKHHTERELEDWWHTMQGHMFMLRGVCPVCGNVNTIYNPPLTMILNCEVAKRQRYLDDHYPKTIFRCYHNGTPHHDKTNFSASAGTLYPMHWFYTSTGKRVHPLANDDCNRRHWKIPKDAVLS